VESSSGRVVEWICSTTRLLERSTAPSLPDLHHHAPAAPEHLRLVHFLDVRRRGDERARRRRPHEVAERVLALGEPRREELHAVVMALDVIEAGALPPHPRRLRRRLLLRVRELDRKSTRLNSS